MTVSVVAPGFRFTSTRWRAFTSAVKGSVTVSLNPGAEALDSILSDANARKFELPLRVCGYRRLHAGGNVDERNLGARDHCSGSVMDKAEY